MHNFFSSVLTKLDLQYNDLDEESNELLRSAAKATGRDIALEL